MKRAFVSSCLLVLSLCGCESMGRGGSSAGSDASAGGQHRVFTPKEMAWEPATSLPPGAQIAKLEGDSAKSGYFAMRIRLPDGYRIPPHWHPNQERVTVVSGMFYLGQGETFDAAAAQALPPGTYTTMPPGMRHFAFAKGVTEIQLATLGPWGITYVNPADDPRKSGKTAGASEKSSPSY